MGVGKEKMQTIRTVCACVWRGCGYDTVSATRYGMCDKTLRNYASRALTLCAWIFVRPSSLTSSCSHSSVSSRRSTPNAQDQAPSNMRSLRELPSRQRGPLLVSSLLATGTVNNSQHTVNRQSTDSQQLVLPLVFATNSSKRASIS